MEEGVKMYEKLLPYDEFKGMKITQYGDIPVSKDMACPECNGSSQFDYLFDDRFAEPTPIGWCDTEYGFMAVFECPKCYTKYRFHISTTGRNNIDEFYGDFALLVHLWRYHQKEGGK